MTGDVERDSGGSGRSRALTGSALNALFARLQMEGPSAQVVYEMLRKRLITYLRMHVPAKADALADEALDRMARRVHEGTTVQNVYLYALGIARLLVRESRGHSLREETAARDAALFQEDADDVLVREALDAALRACMEGLPAGGQELIVEYYSSGAGAARIESRRRIAERLGLGLNALRNRALRLRDMLEQCIGQRLAARDESQRPDTEDE